MNKASICALVAFVLLGCKGDTGFTEYKTYQNTRAISVVDTSRPNGKRVTIPESKSSIYFSLENWDDSIKIGSEIKQIKYYVKSTLWYDDFTGTYISDGIPNKQLTK